VPINAGTESANWAGLSDKAKWLNALQTQIPSPWHNERLGAFTYIQTKLNHHEIYHQQYFFLLISINTTVLAKQVSEVPIKILFAALLQRRTVFGCYYQTVSNLCCQANSGEFL